VEDFSPPGAEEYNNWMRYNNGNKSLFVYYEWQLFEQSIFNILYSFHTIKENRAV
jgi:hypothetical protein